MVPLREIFKILFRSAVAVNIENEDLEDIGNYLRTLAMKSDKSYRDRDGIVLKMS